MKARNKIAATLVGAGLVLSFGGASTAQAATIAVLNTCISGADCAAYNGGPVTITMDTVAGGISVVIDNGTNGDVTEVDLLFSGAVANSGAISLSGGAVPSFTTYTPSGVLNGATMTTQTFSSTFTDASLQFNVRIDLPPPPGQEAARLGPGEDITFWIAGLNLANYTSALAHIQALEDCAGDFNCGGSIKLTPGVPDGGSTVGLLGLALLGLGYVRHRMM